MNNSPIQHGVQNWYLDSWAQFYEFIAMQFSNASAYIFRGHADEKWKIRSSLDRLEEKHPTRPNFSGDNPKEFGCTLVTREDHLAAFRQSTRGRPGVVAPPDDDDECWALAQHHGLATPMLDWTLSPFVALYFAFETPADSANRVVLAVSTSVIGEEDSADDPAPLPFLPDTEASYRLLAQAGLFLKMPKNGELETYVQSHFADDDSRPHSHARAVLMKIHIRNEDRKDCLKMLNKMNINRMSLFPDADGAATFINNLWDIDFDTSLGYIRSGRRK